jgi:hypothetical protein
VGDIKNDRCLLTICGSTIDFCGWFVVRIQQVQGNCGSKLRLSILLANLDVGCPELPVSIGLYDPERDPG